MKFKNYGTNWLVRLEKGELLVEKLTRLVETENIGAAWISGLGAAAWAEIGFYDLGSKQYHWKKVKNLMEITSIQGNVAWDGDKPVIHMHGTFSDQDMNALGGHIKELEAGGTVEILISKFGQDKLTREQDSDTGLKLLSL